MSAIPRSFSERAMNSCSGRCPPPKKRKRFAVGVSAKNESERGLPWHPTRVTSMRRPENGHETRYPALATTFRTRVTNSRWPKEAPSGTITKRTHSPVLPGRHSHGLKRASARKPSAIPIRENTVKHGAKKLGIPRKGKELWFSTAI